MAHYHPQQCAGHKCTTTICAKATYKKTTYGKIMTTTGHTIAVHCAFACLIIIQSLIFIQSAQAESSGPFTAQVSEEGQLIPWNTANVSRVGGISTCLKRKLRPFSFRGQSEGLDNFGNVVKTLYLDDMTIGELSSADVSDIDSIIFGSYRVMFDNKGLQFCEQLIRYHRLPKIGLDAQSLDQLSYEQLTNESIEELQSTEFGRVYLGHLTIRGLEKLRRIKMDVIKLHLLMEKLKRYRQFPLGTPYQKFHVQQYTTEPQFPKYHVQQYTSQPQFQKYHVQQYTTQPQYRAVQVEQQYTTQPQYRAVPVEKQYTSQPQYRAVPVEQQYTTQPQYRAIPVEEQYITQP